MAAHLTEVDVVDRVRARVEHGLVGLEGPSQAPQADMLLCHKGLEGRAVLITTSKRRLRICMQGGDRDGSDGRVKLLKDWGLEDLKRPRMLSTERLLKSIRWVLWKLTMAQI
jgi:hypothetical protein